MARRSPNPRSRSRSPAAPLSWTATLNLSASPPPPSLTGDKLLLPPSTLEALLSAASSSASAQALRSSNIDPASWDYLSPDEIYAQQREQGTQLPHPLTFNIVNTANGKSTHAGVREFSAEEGGVVLSSYLRKTLDIPEGDNGDVIQLSITSRSLPKGTFAKLRPLEPGYDEDWRPLLETHLRKNFTTLTVGDTLDVPSVNGQAVFRFLVGELKPENAVCIIDTDLDVDIEPLDEEQARESLKRKAASGVTSTGGEVTVGKAVRGEVTARGYVHFQLKKWDKTVPLRVELNVANEGDEVDFVVSTEKLHRKPSIEEHEWASFGDKYPKHVVLDEDKVRAAQELWISVYGYAQSAEEDSKPFTLLVIPETKDDDEDEEMDGVADPDREICSNCKQAIPKRTMFLHQNFCFRNNTLCKHGCGQVFKRGTETLHWHCDLCTAYGTNTSTETDTQSKHNFYSHTPQKCGFCNHSTGSMSELSSHKTNECPGKLILCRFCHLILPQEGDENNAATLFMTDLTPHEVSCGSRTTECHLCSRIVQLKQLDVHLRHHDIERKSTPLPRICRNVNCARTSTGAGNNLGLCSICYGPLYSASHDPDFSGLSRRVKRKYDMQLLVGCKKAWCTNAMCKTGRSNMSPPMEVISSAEAGRISKEYSDAGKLVAGYTAGPLHLCVDEGTAKRRAAAEKLSMMQDGDDQGGWALEWCVKAVEESSKAGEPDEGFEEAGIRWLEKWGVKRGEKV